MGVIAFQIGNLQTLGGKRTDMAYVDFLLNMGHAFLIFTVLLFCVFFILVLIAMPHEWRRALAILITLKYRQINLVQCL